MNFEKPFDFFLSKKSTVASVENFVEQFNDTYEEVDSREKDLLIKCIQQMFKKYYYSTLLPEMDVSPAVIIGTLTERELLKDTVIVPVMKVDLKGRMLKRINIGTVCYSCDEHPFVMDLQYYVEFIKKASYEIDEYGMIPEVEKTGLSKEILIDDRHYMNILCMLALEAGLVKRTEVLGRKVAKVSPAFKEFAGMEAKKKLEYVIDAAIKLSSKMLIVSLPAFREEFSESNIRSLLKKPKEYDKFTEAVMLKCGFDPKKIELMTEQLETGNIDIFGKEIDIENASVLLAYRMFFDMYFITLFGYYLQLIQPMYIDIYDINSEVENLLESLNDYKIARMKLFLAAEAFDLTPIGETILVGKRKPKRLFTIPDEINDDDMYDLICASKEYIDSEDYDENEDDYEDEYEYEASYDDNDTDYEYTDDYEAGLHNAVEAFMTRGKAEASTMKKNKGQKIETIISNPELDAKVFSFKVKWFYNKREWHQIEILGSNTLDALHDFIMNSFELEFGHLYSFFMSNKAWDSSTEYSHPQGSGNSAKKIRISGLSLELKQKFLYIYDYGKEQRFEIELTGINERAEGVKYPVEAKRSKA